MKQALLNKYCDEVLRILDKHIDRTQLLFGVGEFRDDLHVPNELFVKIKLAEDDIHMVINKLKACNYIETDTHNRANFYDLGKKESINSSVYGVRLTDAGKYFIQTSSFAREARRNKLNKWVPNISNITSLSAILISIMTCIFCFAESRDTKHELQKQRALIEHMNTSQNSTLYHMDSMLHYELPR